MILNISGGGIGENVLVGDVDDCEEIGGVS